ncbi:hypothetical protein DID88_007719 [Monilinia fructigena]|uniref:DNA mismatch repair protein MutS core domain-containing protein n=1 Tax=Monilinia fructigena TaxID=38457 RepID=A0A395J341_9HELO|nr:hypothetical protein DID88_007719 [Monilinia fructigena]
MYRSLFCYQSSTSNLERSIVKDKSPERVSLEFLKDVQDLLQEPEPAATELEELPNSKSSQDFEEVSKKAKPSRRARKTESLPQGLITLDSESSDVQEYQDTSSPSAGGEKVRKTKSYDELELHQGLLPLEPLQIEHEPPPYPTVIMQARNNMFKFENCVVVTRVGGFYEMYFEHADEFGPLLGLKVSQKKTNAGVVSMLPEVRPISEWTHMLESPVSPSSVNAFTEEEISAGSCLLHYVETRLQSTNMKLQPPVRQLNVMGIDKNTMRALEIKKTIKEDNFSGSLLHTIRRTVTKGGARLLENWLASPSTSLEVINSRLDLVACMLEDGFLRGRATTLLKRSHDSHRLLQKFAFGRGDGDDLLDLASTIHATRDLASILDVQKDTPEPCIQALLARIHLKGPMKLAQAITDAIDEEGLDQQHRIEEGKSGEMQALAEAIVASEGTTEETSTLRKHIRKKQPNSLRDYYNQENEAWIMKPDATPTLKRLHKKLSSLSDQKTALAASLCDRLGATTLTLRFTPGLGHICHVKGKDINLNMPEARTISSSRSTRSLHHPEMVISGPRDRPMSHPYPSRRTANLLQIARIGYCQPRENFDGLDSSYPQYKFGAQDYWWEASYR